METFDLELESPATNHNEKRFVETLERDKKKANRYLIVDMVCYSLIPIIIVGVIFLLGRNIYLFSILCGIIAAAFVWRVRQKWWSSVNIRQFIERETDNDNLLQAAWIGMHRKERLGFFDLIVQRAWQVVRRFEIPPPWPVMVDEVELGAYAQTIGSIVEATCPDGFRLNSDIEPQAPRDYLRYGGSPRGAQALTRLAKVAALTEGSPFVKREHLQKILPPALRHRILLRYEYAMRTTPDDLLMDIFERMVRR